MCLTAFATPLLVPLAPSRPRLSVCQTAHRQLRPALRRSRSHSHSAAGTNIDRITTTSSSAARFPDPFNPKKARQNQPSSSASSSSTSAPSRPNDDDGPPLFVADDPPLFADDAMEQLWDSTDTDSIFSPLRDEEEAILREKLPRRLAEFFIDRAGDAARLRTPRTPSDTSFVGRLLSDMPPETPDWEDAVNDEYRDYVYVTTTEPPTGSYRWRRGSALFGGNDGLPDLDPATGMIGSAFVGPDGQQVIRPVTDPAKQPVDRSTEPRLVSLFVGQVNSIDEQAARLGYGALAILAVWFILKLVFAVISFFLSFTFSFFAIFALSAGLFVLFFFIRF